MANRDTTTKGVGNPQANCPDGLCSVGLMKSFCPSCMLAGLVLLPFELLGRLVKWMVNSGAGNPAGSTPSGGAEPR
jgi:hypothetical protein